MTREEILAMPAGDDLDKLVAEHIMGWTDLRKQKHWWNKFDETEEWYGTYTTIAPSTMRSKVDDWSTDIEYAWLVMERVASLGCRLVLEDWRECEKDSGIHGWAAYFDIPGGHTTEQVVAESAPLAICRAALLATLATKSSPMTGLRAHLDEVNAIDQNRWQKD